MDKELNNTAFLFPGQGSQTPGMAKQLCAEYKIADDIFTQANDVLGFDLKKLCFEGEMAELTKTQIAQPALLTHGFAAYSVYSKLLGIKPVIGAGHSLGEITALACCGAIGFEDAVQIVHQRGLFMQEAAAEGVGAMSAISGLDFEEIFNACKEHNTTRNEDRVVVSNYNSTIQSVISGYKEDVKELEGKLKSKGAIVIPLKVSAPFHSPLMESAAEKFRDYLGQFQFGSFAWPVVSNVTAEPYNKPDSIIDNLYQQLIKTVQWVPTMHYLVEAGVETALELGPKAVLKKLLATDVKNIKTYAVDDENDKKALEIIKKNADTGVTGISGLKLMSKCLAIVVCTKNSNWNNEEYTKGVIEPYRRIKAMREVLIEKSQQPSGAQLLDTLEMLEIMFKTKQVSADEVNARYEQLVQEAGLKELMPDYKIPSFSESLTEL